MEVTLFKGEQQREFLAIRLHRREASQPQPGNRDLKKKKL